MRVVVVDDDSIVLMSLKTIIEANGIEVCATGKNGQEAIELYRSNKPDVLLSDIRMEGMTGIEAAREIVKEFPDAKILFLTTFSDDEYVVEALKCGAKGYILKQDYEGIVPAINAVHTGQSVFGGEIISKIPSINKEVKVDYEKKNITDKEYDIIKLVAEGLNNKEIASELFLSEGTVRNYLSNILEKLGVRDRTQLVVYYYKHMN
ncbi:MAG: response regulator transcription factor [Lachnospiraceae bacterium]|nr:response regulator transcription factor [Lachnospiraceae bacterium]